MHLFLVRSNLIEDVRNKDFFILINGITRACFNLTIRRKFWLHFRNVNKQLSSVRRLWFFSLWICKHGRNVGKQVPLQLFTSGFPFRSRVTGRFLWMLMFLEIQRAAVSNQLWIINETLLVQKMLLNKFFFVLQIKLNALFRCFNLIRR